jgi:hypothetical protein
MTQRESNHDVGRRLVRVALAGALVAGAASSILMAQAGQSASAAPAVTFARDVAPIFQEKCEICHRAQGMAPMSLVTFADVRPWVRSIKAKVLDRQMPPWYVDKTVGIQKFANDRSLSDQQIETIAKWVDAGAPLGNAKDLPPPREWPAGDSWQLESYFGRPPDVVVRSEEYTMPAVAQDRWWDTIGEPAIPEERWVAGTETRPASQSRKVVHHATTKLYQQEPRTAASTTTRDDAAVADANRGRSFSEWAVGKNGELYVEQEAGQLFRAGARIGWDVHISASGKDTPVIVETAFWFYPKDQPPKYRAQMTALGYAAARNLEIPPGTITRQEGYHVMRSAAILMNFQPHMHMRGKAFSMEAIYPDGRVEMLNHVSRYAFNWHINYIYEKDAAPVLPKGTVVKLTAWHDNTAANRANPDPTQWVTFGQRSVDEMMHANAVIVPISDDDYERITAERKQRAVKATQNQ